jgi:hypothetical protein
MIVEIECRSHDPASVEGYSPAAYSRNLGNQAVSVEPAKGPADLGAFLLPRQCRTWTILAFVVSKYF